MSITQKQYEPKHYPLYELVVDDQHIWSDFRGAARWYDSGWCRVSFGHWVIEAAGVMPRTYTSQDKARISDAADEVSASK